ncbi:sigma-70 family RNA polymerase sigma factor [Gimesia benthica]|uniref:Sigma-70 family RNA polymerase sigma factor n=1 Tax=Gimesia benthica TaxID=2608982 RepID=A0A6I6ARI0_9PLAN|nr:sigma-70 family RNA polymerase sigma factor [Gimesia benthica]
MPRQVRQAARAEEQLRLATALAYLSAAQRQAIELHYLQDWSLERIGQRMNKTKGAVASLIYRGTSKLRELLVNESRGDHG